MDIAAILIITGGVIVAFTTIISTELQLAQSDRID